MSENLIAQAPEFEEFPKIARLARPVIITEKIDGTNGCIYIGPSDTDPFGQVYGGLFLVGSRSRWISPASDNHGFAAWAYAHKDELMTLGPGRHFGEWWGHGIQRGYGLKNGDKRFSLFNTTRWCLFGKDPIHASATKMQQVLPACVGLVPVIYEGEFDTQIVSSTLIDLAMLGSRAAPGFMNPEGVVIYHSAANIAFKKTIKNDESPKGLL